MVIASTAQNMQHDEIIVFRVKYKCFDHRWPEKNTVCVSVQSQLKLTRRNLHGNNKQQSAEEMFTLATRI